MPANLPPPTGSRRTSPLAAMRRAVLTVLRNWRHLTPAGGETIRKLEELFAEYVGGHALAVSSGTVALEVALRAAGIGPGAEVILSPYDWGAAAGAVLRCGAKPVFADIDPRTATLEPASIARYLGPRTKALVVTHWAGCPADMESILKVVQPHEVFVLEDCAQALGATCQGRLVGSFGHAAAFSFGWGKLVCAGEGGMVVFREAETRRAAIGLSQHPLRQWREGARGWGDLALNARMHPLAAALVLGQWNYWPQWLEQRRKACLSFSRQIAGLEQLILPEDPPSGKHSFHRYVLRTSNEAEAQELIGSLSARGWPVAAASPQEPLSQRPELQSAAKALPCPQAERACKVSILFDVDWHRISEKTIAKLARAVREEVEKWRSSR